VRLAAMGAIVAVLAAGAACAKDPAPAAPPVSEEETYAGCIHTDLRPCMISLGSALWFDMNRVAAIIAKRNELDVNGRTAHRNIGMITAVPGHTERIGITLTLASPAPNDTVVKVEIELPWDPELAHTPSEYDKTFLFDVLVPVLGRSCPGLDRLTLYRFFENQVKPREITQQHDDKRGLFNHTVAETDTGPIPFCGTSFRFHRHTEWEGTPEIHGPRNAAGSTAIVLE
jgi:hypothetical protein